MLPASPVGVVVHLSGSVEGISEQGVRAIRCICHPYVCPSSIPLQLRASHRFYLRLPADLLHFLVSSSLPAAIKVDKENMDYNKLRVKQLKGILADRGVDCDGCLEKSDYVARCKATEHLEL